MTDKLYVSPSPHLRQGDTTRKLMGDVIIALIPAVLASGIIFGYQSLIVMAVSVLSCVVLEYICRKVMKRDNTVTDLSAVVTGILLACNLPSSVPVWMPVIGTLLAIVLGCAALALAGLGLVAEQRKEPQKIHKVPENTVKRAVCGRKAG